MMKTSKECSYAIRSGVGAGVFITEYPQEAYAAWMEAEFQSVRQVAGEIEQVPVAFGVSRPVPVAQHVFTLTPTQHYHGWGYALAFCEMLEGHEMALTAAEIEDIRFRLRMGLVEPKSF